MGFKTVSQSISQYYKKKGYVILISFTLLVILFLSVGIVVESPLVKKNKIIYTVCGNIYKISKANAQTVIPCPPTTGEPPCCSVCNASGGCTTACNPNC